MDDQDLLTKFSCMGTQDRDVLVGELYDLLDSQLSREGCVFFLEMNNWNLQAAVGAFYDFYGQSDLQPPQVCVVKDFSVNEGGPVPPLSSFTKTWRVRNAGSYPWPMGAYISQWSGHMLGASSVTSLPSLGPGEEANVSVSLTSPNVAGLFQSQWKMFTPSGAMCGGTLFITVIVEDSTVMGVTEQLSTISTNEGDMDTGGAAVGGASLIDTTHNTFEQRNPFASPSSTTSHLSPDLSNSVPHSTAAGGVNSSATMATGIDASRRLLGNSPSELSTLVTTLTDSIHTRLPDSTFVMSDSNSTHQQQKNGNGTSTEGQDCGNFDSAMASDDFGAGNIYPS